jgi:HD-GYP domain-containing protein (c-di-GMP phosphodiesterase class II)
MTTASRSARYKLLAEHVAVGEALPFNVFDAADRLLLRKGHVIATDAQLERLIEFGLYADEEPRSLRAGTAGAPCAAPSLDDPLKTRVSVYAQMVDTAREVDALVRGAAPGTDVSEPVQRLAGRLLAGLQLDTEATLAHLMFAREVSYPVRHLVNCAIVTALLLQARAHPAPAARAAVAAALTMNVAMLDLQQLLFEQNAALDEEQKRRVQTHPQDAVAWLAARGVTDPLWLQVVAQHHEVLTGGGYPAGLKGDAVCLEAQAVALADRFCSAVTERAYRAAISPEVALRELAARNQGALDETLMAHLQQIVGPYPPGAVVEVVNRDVAVVTPRLRDARAPVVFSVAPGSRHPYPQPKKRLTASQPQFRIEALLPRGAIAFAVDPEQLWPRTLADEPAER